MQNVKIMNFKKGFIFSFTIIISQFGLSYEDDSSYTIKNIVRYPYSSVQGPFIGIFLALSLPLELPDIDVFFSYNLEANYVLPQNETDFTYPPLVSKRAWDRKFFYDLLEFKVKAHGFPGKNCLLRAICETSLHTSENTGILGDILHILLTPSSSVDANIHQDYVKAEQFGKFRKSCKKYEKKCSISLVGLISKVESFF